MNIEGQKPSSYDGFQPSEQLQQKAVKHAREELSTLAGRVGKLKYEHKAASLITRILNRLPLSKFGEKLEEAKNAVLAQQDLLKNLENMKSKVVQEEAKDYDSGGEAGVIKTALQDLIQDLTNLQKKIDSMEEGMPEECKGKHGMVATLHPDGEYATLLKNLDKVQQRKNILTTYLSVSQNLQDNVSGATSNKLNPTKYLEIQNKIKTLKQELHDVGPIKRIAARLGIGNSEAMKKVKENLDALDIAKTEKHAMMSAAIQQRIGEQIHTDGRASTKDIKGLKDVLKFEQYVEMKKSNPQNFNAFMPKLSAAFKDMNASHLLTILGNNDFTQLPDDVKNKFHEALRPHISKLSQEQFTAAFTSNNINQSFRTQTLQIELINRIDTFDLNQLLKYSSKVGAATTGKKDPAYDILLEKAGEHFVKMPLPDLKKLVSGETFASSSEAMRKLGFSHLLKTAKDDLNELMDIAKTSCMNAANNDGLESPLRGTSSYLFYSVMQEAFNQAGADKPIKAICKSVIATIQKGEKINDKDVIDSIQKEVINSLTTFSHNKNLQTLCSSLHEGANIVRKRYNTEMKNNPGKMHKAAITSAELFVVQSFMLRVINPIITQSYTIDKTDNDKINKLTKEIESLKKIQCDKTKTSEEIQSASEKAKTLEKEIKQIKQPQTTLREISAKIQKIKELNDELTQIFNPDFGGL